MNALVYIDTHIYIYMHVYIYICMYRDLYIYSDPKGDRIFLEGAGFMLELCWMLAT